MFGLVEKMDRTSQKADPSISEIIQAGSIWEAFSLIARTGQSAIVWTHRADITDPGQERNNPCPVVLGDNSISRTSVLIYLSVPDIWSSRTPVTQSSRSGFLLPNDQFGWGQGALWFCTLAMPIFSNLGFLPTPISTALLGSSIPFTLSGKSQLVFNKLWKAKCIVYTLVNAKTCKLNFLSLKLSYFHIIWIISLLATDIWLMFDILNKKQIPLIGLEYERHPSNKHSWLALWQATIWISIFQQSHKLKYSSTTGL